MGLRKCKIDVPDNEFSIYTNIILGWFLRIINTDGLILITKMFKPPYISNPLS